MKDLTAGDPRPEIRATGHEVYAVSCWGAGRIAEAVEHLDMAMDLLAQVPPNTADAFEMEKRLVSTTFWIWHHAARGDMSQEEVFARYDGLIAAMPDRFAVASTCGFAATTAITLGSWEGADRFSGIGMAADAGGQFGFWSGQFLMHQGIVRALDGPVDDALAGFDKGKAIYTGIGGRSALSTFEASLAMNVARRGRLADAQARVAAARAELDTHREGWNAPIVLIAEGVVAHAAGDVAAAADRLARAVARATDQGSHRFARRAADVAAELGVDLDLDSTSTPARARAGKPSTRGLPGQAESYRRGGSIDADRPHRGEGRATGAGPRTRSPAGPGSGPRRP